jgi:hypothetical protein
MFQVLKTDPKNPTVVIPKSENYKSFDGFLYNGEHWFPLQISINTTKSLEPCLLKEFADTFPTLLRDGKLYWYAVVLPSKGFRTAQYSMNKKDEECRKWAKGSVVQHVIPFPRQVDSLSEYSDAEKEILLGLKKDIYKGVKNRLKALSANS